MRRIPAAELERFVAASPLRIRLLDVHTNAPPRYPVSVTVERVGPDGPRRLDVAYKVAAGVVSFVGLARSHTVGASVDLRIRVDADGVISETATGAEYLEVTVPSWTSAAPPAVIDAEIRFFPASTYRFAPGLAIADGRVVDGAAAPVSRAKVSRTENVDGNVLIEEGRTDAIGNFRLPLRWSDGPTVLTARHEAATGTANVAVPAGLIDQVVITIA